jgi:hypothetical protein
MHSRARVVVRTVLFTAALAATALVTLAVTGSAATRHSASATKVTQPTKNIPGPRGSRGPRGFKGDKGDPGTPATKLWAIFNPNGTLVAYSGATANYHDGTGKYRIVFNTDISKCAFVATGTINLTLANAQILVSTKPNTLYVNVFSLSGAPSLIDSSFNVAVFC